MTVEAIKEAIVRPSEPERNQLAEWFDELTEDEWDKQIAKDFAPGGRRVAWGEKVHVGIEGGKFRPVQEFCEKRNTQHE